LRERFPALSRIAFGDLFLTDVRAYREALLASVGLEAYFPLWALDTRVLAERFVTLGYRARLVCVDTTQLAPSFAGRQFDATLLADLPASVDPCGERGEFHTFVSDGPIFRTPVRHGLGEVVMREERFAYCDLLDDRSELSP
jgi:diphthamide synthase (EF-2-diphthine--ammonia ligase)